MKFFKKALLLLLSAVMASLAVACASDTPETVITLSKTSIKLTVGETAELTATVVPESEVEWVVSDETIVSFSDGVVTALKVGTATVTAKAGGSESKCTVVVREIEKSYSVLLNNSSKTIYLGDTFRLVAQVKYGDDIVDGANVSWSVAADGGDVASVDENGEITALGIGSTSVTASYKPDGGTTVSAVCTVTVKSRYSITVAQRQEKLVAEEGTFTAQELSTEYSVVDENDELVADVDADALEFRTLNPDIVSYDEDTDTFTALTDGKAKIRVSYIGAYADINVTVLGSVSYLTADMFSYGPYDYATMTDGADNRIVYSAPEGFGGWRAIENYTEPDGGIEHTDWTDFLAFAEEYGYIGIVQTVYRNDGPNGTNTGVLMSKNQDANTADLKVGSITAGSLDEAQMRIKAVRTGDVPLVYVKTLEEMKTWTTLRIMVDASGMRSDASAEFSIALVKTLVQTQDAVKQLGCDPFTPALPVVMNKDGEVTGLTVSDFTFTVLDEDVVSFDAAAGTFTALKGGDASVKVEYEDVVSYMTVTVIDTHDGAPLNIADIVDANDFEFGWWKGEAATLTEVDGKYVLVNGLEVAEGGYNGEIVEVRLGGDVLNYIRRIAWECGYTTLRVEVYKNDDGVLCKDYISNMDLFTDVFANYDTNGYCITNTASADQPIIGYKTAPLSQAEADLTWWTHVSVGVWGNGSIEFSLFLTKYDVTVKDKVVVSGDSFVLDLPTVTCNNETIQGLTLDDFTFVSLNEDVVTFNTETKQFDVTGSGKATVCVDYKGHKAYAIVSVPDLTSEKLNILEIVGEEEFVFGWWGGSVGADKVQLGFDNGRITLTNNMVEGEAPENYNGDQCFVGIAGAATDLIRAVASTNGYTKIRVEVYSNDDKVLTSNTGEGNLMKQYESSGLVIDLDASDDTPIVAEITDPLVADNAQWWQQMNVGVRGTGTIVFSLFLVK